MPVPAKKSVTTPIPVQLSPTEFNEFLFPHLSMPKRGPQCKLGYHCVFNLILWVLYTGMQWKCLPVPTDTTARRPSITRPSTKSSLGGLTTAPRCQPSIVSGLTSVATSLRACLPNVWPGLRQSLTLAVAYPDAPRDLVP